MSFVGGIGARVIRGLRSASNLAAVAWTVLGLAVMPRNWPRTTRMVFARQILFTGVEALGFVSVIAVMTGVLVVVQTQFWLGKMGQSALLGPILVTVIVRELGPLLVNFVIVGRSGTAIAVELANMRVLGEVRILDAQGLDPIVYLAMPRVLGMMTAVFCLTIHFTVIALSSGFAAATLAGIGGEQLAGFLDSVLKAVGPADVYNLLAKTLITPMLMAVICVGEGFSVKGSITEVPQAATRAVVRSVTTLFVMSALISVLTYV